MLLYGVTIDIDTEFPRPPGGESVIYCNSASIGRLPARTVAVLDEWNQLRAEPWRITFEQQVNAAARARELSARLIGAQASEIALVPNTTAGLNLAAQILPIPHGKVVLGHGGEFPANVYPWLALERSAGVVFEQIPLVEDGLPDWNRLAERLDRRSGKSGGGGGEGETAGDVAVVAVSWVSFVSGDRADLMRIGAMCRERGVWFVVDGIQGVGTTELDVRACNIDVLACGAQKWLLSPWGSGFCYIRRELVERFDPRSVGWLGLRHSHDFGRMLEYDLTYVDDASKFEFAATGYQDLAAMNASLELLAEYGMERVYRHIHRLAGQLVDGLGDMEGVTLVTPRDPSRRAGIVSFRVRDAAPVSRDLDSAGVSHSVRGSGVLRLSPHIHNSIHEMDRILEVIGNAVRAAGDVARDVARDVAGEAARSAVGNAISHRGNGLCAGGRSGK